MPLLLLAALALGRPLHPAANAGELPILADLLTRAGWSPTPELSGVFQPGDVFRITPAGHQLFAAGCVTATPRESSYTGLELTSQLSLGVGVARGGLTRKLRFGAPAQRTLAEIDLVPSPACAAALAQAPRPEELYLVKEVLIAELSEQICGQLDAKGRFLPAASPEAEARLGCAQIALLPVAVGFRTQAIGGPIRAEGPDPAFLSVEPAGDLSPVIVRVGDPPTAPGVALLGLDRDGLVDQLGEPAAVGFISSLDWGSGPGLRFDGPPTWMIWLDEEGHAAQLLYAPDPSMPLPDLREAGW